MAICEPQLYRLLKSIEPTRTQKDGAQRSHSYLREILCTGNMAARVSGSYLSGSYARDTAIYPLDDVDIIFLIEPNAWSKWFDPVPDTVLSSFARAIRYRYGNSSVHVQRRSIGLKLHHLDIDVVPAIDKGDELIRVPDRTSGEWITSAPKRHSRIATSVNQKCDGKFKPLVKLIKYWNANLPSTASLKSFTIETLATHVFQNDDFTTLDEGLLLFFDFLAYCKGKNTLYRWNSSYGINFGLFSVRVPDTAGTGSNVAARVTTTQAARFLEHAVRSRDKMKAAEATIYEDTAFNRACEALKIPIAREARS